MNSIILVQIYKMVEIWHKLMEFQLNFRKGLSNSADQELAVIMLKPNYLEEHEAHVKNFIKSNSLSILHETSIQLDKKAVLVLYNDIFRFSTSDTKFGTDWKLDKMNYMISNLSKIYIICGNKAHHYSENLKYEIRKKYNKLSIPDKLLDRNTILELAIRNIIHVVDDHEVESSLLLFSIIDY